MQAPAAVLALHVALPMASRLAVPYPTTSNLVTEEPSADTWPDNFLRTATGLADVTDASDHWNPGLDSLTTTSSPLVATVVVPELAFVKPRPSSAGAVVAAPANP